MNYPAMWLYFYEQWLESVVGTVYSSNLAAAREHADKCIKSMKDSENA